MDISIHLFIQELNKLFIHSAPIITIMIALTIPLLMLRFIKLLFAPHSTIHLKEIKKEPYSPYHEEIEQYYKSSTNRNSSRINNHSGRLNKTKSTNYDYTSQTINNTIYYSSDKSNSSSISDSSSSSDSSSYCD